MLLSKQWTTDSGQPKSRRATNRIGVGGRGKKEEEEDGIEHHWRVGEGGSAAGRGARVDTPSRDTATIPIISNHCSVLTRVNFPFLCLF